jgi:hypothetical protein
MFHCPAVQIVLCGGEFRCSKLVQGQLIPFHNDREFDIMGEKDPLAPMVDEHAASAQVCGSGSIR